VAQIVHGLCRKLLSRSRFTSYQDRITSAFSDQPNHFKRLKNGPGFARHRDGRCKVVGEEPIVYVTVTHTDTVFGFGIGNMGASLDVTYDFTESLYIPGVG
jgi:hypothetical protein